MKILLTVAAVIAVAVAGPTRGRYEPVHVGPAVVDGFEPIHVGPAVVDEFEPIHVGPALVDEFEPIHVGPALVDEFEPIHVGPALVDFPVHEGTIVPKPVASSPLVQIIVNVNKQFVDEPNHVEPVERPMPEEVAEEEVIPTPVEVVDVAEEEPESVLVVDEPLVAPEPVIVAPEIVAPVVIGPETLN